MIREAEGISFVNGMKTHYSLPILVEEVYVRFEEAGESGKGEQRGGSEHKVRRSLGA